MINETKPTTSITNSAKVSFGETWDNNLETWDEDTQSWDRSGSLFTNSSRQSSAITNQAKPI